MWVRGYVRVREDNVDVDGGLTNQVTFFVPRVNVLTCKPSQNTLHPLCILILANCLLVSTPQQSPVGL